MSHEITIRAVLEGEENVKGGFKRMADSSANMSREIKFLGREMAILGSSVHAVGLLGKQFGILNDEQAKVLTTMGSMMALSGSVVRALGYLADSSKLVALTEHARGTAHFFADTMAAGITKIVGAITGALSAIATSSFAVAIAEKARAIAHAIAHALSGPLGWAILAGAIAAAGIGISLAASIPSKQYGGVVERTGPYLLHAGEFVVPRGGAITINIYGAGSPRATGDAVIDALRRSGVI